MGDKGIRKLGFYESYWETAKLLDNESQRLRFLEAIFRFGFEGVKPDFSDDKLLECIFVQTKANLLADLRRKHGGAPAGNKNARKTEAKAEEEEPPEEEAEDEGEKEAEENAEAKPKRAPKRFVKPSVSEIKAYCAERGNAVNAQAFFDFYESNGWKVGKNSMKDWKASVRTWEQKDGFKAPVREKLEMWN